MLVVFICETYRGNIIITYILQLAYETSNTNGGNRLPTHHHPQKYLNVIFLEHQSYSRIIFILLVGPEMVTFKVTGRGGGEYNHDTILNF